MLLLLKKLLLRLELIQNLGIKWLQLVLMASALVDEVHSAQLHIRPQHYHELVTHCNLLYFLFLQRENLSGKSSIVAISVSELSSLVLSPGVYFSISIEGNR